MGSSFWSSCFCGKSSNLQGHHLIIIISIISIITIIFNIQIIIIIVIIQSGYPGFGYPPTPPKESPGGVDPSTPSPMPGKKSLL